MLKAKNGMGTPTGKLPIDVTQLLFDYAQREIRPERSRRTGSRESLDNIAALTGMCLMQGMA
jgi:hypothetical protein